MSARSLAEVLLKTWAVVLIVGALLTIPTLIGSFAYPSADVSSSLIAAWWFVQAGLTVIAGVALIKFSPDIARWLQPNDEPAERAISLPSLEIVAFGVLGAYFLVKGLRDVGALVFQLMTKPRYETESISYLWRQTPDALVGAIVQSVAGLALLLGRSGIASLWRGLRRTPLPKYSNSESESGESGELK